MSEKDTVIQIIKERGACSTIVNCNEAGCPLCSSRLNLCTKLKTHESRYQYLVYYYLKKHGNKASLVEILL
jgi:hypothetical protein